MNNKLIKIMYDPLSYIDKERLRLNENIVQTNEIKSICNKIILTTYNIEDMKIELNEITLFWINNWFEIVSISYLLGCLSYKENIFWRGGVFKIPTWCIQAIRFLPIKIENQVFKKNTEIVTHKDIVLEGYSQLKDFIEELPLSISKRINIMYPEYVINSATTKKISMTILNTVAIYVKKNKIR